MTLREWLALLGAATWVSVGAAWKSLTSPADFVQVAGLLVARANVKATGLADADVARSLGTDVLGLEREDDVPRLEAALLTIMEARGEPEPRFERLARTEPMNAARRAQVRAMRAHGVQGWTRDVGPDACALCREWAGGGEVFPADQELRQHPNCDCLARPVAEDREEVRT